MKPKIFLVLSILLFSAGTDAQTTVDVFFNGTKSGQYLIKEDATTGGISYKKSVYKNLDRLSIQLKGKSIQGPYLKTVEVMGDDDTPVFTAHETEGAEGQFVLTDKAVIKRLIKGKPIKLILVKSPANSKMMMPSRKIYIGTISRN
jgi:hypothetical protein